MFINLQDLPEIKKEEISNKMATIYENMSVFTDTRRIWGKDDFVFFLMEYTWCNLKN